jgi:hypothetical protein
MVRMIMHLFDGLPLRFTHTDLEAMAAEKAMVILHRADHDFQPAHMVSK